MTEPNVRSTDPQKLSRLWQCDTDALTTWQPDELASIFKHLLAPPLVDELGTIAPQLAESLQQPGTAPGETPETFGDLLHHAQPPLDVLKLIKEYCKRADGDESLRSTLAAACNLAHARSVGASTEQPIHKVAVLVTPPLRQAVEQLGFARDAYDFPLVVHALDPAIDKKDIAPERWYVSAND